MDRDDFVPTVCGAFLGVFAVGIYFLFWVRRHFG